MNNLTLTKPTDNLYSYSSSSSSPLLTRNLHHHHGRRLHFFSTAYKSNSKLKFVLSSSIKQKGDRQKEEEALVVTGLRLENSDKLKPADQTETDSRQMSSWPPWKNHNLPRRYILIGTTSLAFVVCNMDKVNLSIAIIPMSHQFGWNSSTAGLVQSSFFWGYAFSQLPGGWLSKFFGGRKVLEVGVLMWSLATILVPFASGFMPGLILSRILVGIGEVFPRQLQLT